MIERLALNCISTLRKEGGGQRGIKDEAELKRQEREDVTSEERNEEWEERKRREKVIGRSHLRLPGVVQPLSTPFEAFCLLACGFLCLERSLEINSFFFLLIVSIPGFQYSSDICVQFWKFDKNWAMVKNGLKFGLAIAVVLGLLARCVVPSSCPCFFFFSFLFCFFVLFSNRAC